MELAAILLGVPFPRSLAHLSAFMASSTDTTYDRMNDEYDLESVRSPVPSTYREVVFPAVVFPKVELPEEYH